MQTFKHVLQKLTPLEISIINQKTPYDEPLQIQFERGYSQEGDALTCTITTLVFRESEMDKEERSFQIRYTVEAVYGCDEKDIDREELYETITKELYAYIRLGLMSIIGAAGIDSISLPYSL